MAAIRARFEKIGICRTAGHRWPAVARLQWARPHDGRTDNFRARTTVAAEGCVSGGDSPGLPGPHREIEPGAERLHYGYGGVGVGRGAAGGSGDSGREVARAAAWSAGRAEGSDRYGRGSNHGGQRAI